MGRALAKPIVPIVKQYFDGFRKSSTHPTRLVRLFRRSIAIRKGVAVIIDGHLKGDLVDIQELADEICDRLGKILDQEP